MILAILQARSTSTRLPGKVLAPVLGKAMLLRQVERLRASQGIDELVVATSVERSDDQLVSVLESAGVGVWRGPLKDVASRFEGISAQLRPSTIVRLTGDCPLADHEVIDKVIGEHRTSGADYTSNTVTRTYPQGLDVECVTTAAFGRMLDLPLTETEREHVTMGLYSRPDQFAIHSVTQGVDRSLMRWTVDRPDDLEFVRAVYAHLYEANPDFLQADIVALLERHPELQHTN